jgi:hypothetical protein
MARNSLCNVLFWFQMCGHHSPTTDFDELTIMNLKYFDRDKE